MKNIVSTDFFYIKDHANRFFRKLTGSDSLKQFVLDGQIRVNVFGYACVFQIDVQAAWFFMVWIGFQ